MTRHAAWRRESETSGLLPVRVTNSPSGKSVGNSSAKVTIAGHVCEKNFRLDGHWDKKAERKPKSVLAVSRRVMAMVSSWSMSLGMELAGVEMIATTRSQNRTRPSSKSESRRENRSTTRRLAELGRRAGAEDILDNGTCRIPHSEKLINSDFSSHRFESFLCSCSVRQGETPLRGWCTLAV